MILYSPRASCLCSFSWFMPSLHHPSFQRNDFSTCNREVVLFWMLKCTSTKEKGPQSVSFIERYFLSCPSFSLLYQRFYCTIWVMCEISRWAGVERRSRRWCSRWTWGRRQCQRMMEGQTRGICMPVLWGPWPLATWGNVIQVSKRSHASVGHTSLTRDAVGWVVFWFCYTGTRKWGQWEHPTPSLWTPSATHRLDPTAVTKIFYTLQNKWFVLYIIFVSITV